MIWSGLRGFRSSSVQFIKTYLQSNRKLLHSNARLIGLTKTVSLPVLLFQFFFFFLDTLIQIIICWIIKINDFWDDLTDISAGTEALLLTSAFLAELSVSSPRKIIILII